MAYMSIDCMLQIYLDRGRRWNIWNLARHPDSTEHLETTRVSKPGKAPGPSKAEAERAELGLKVLYDGDGAEVEYVPIFH